MKILHVIPYFSPHFGGDVNVVYNVSKQLAIKKHEVTIITTDYEFDDVYAKSILGVHVLTFKCNASFSFFLYSPKMKKWLNNNIVDFDIVHMHTFRSYQNNVIHRYTKKYKIPYILQAHGSAPIMIQKQNLKKIYDYIWGNRILTDASKIIALTKEEVEQYKKFGVDEDKIEILPNGIDLDEYYYLPEKGKFRKKNLIREDEKIILFLGRLHKIKGIDLLVKSFADIINKIDSVKLVIVGPDDGFLSTLKRQIEDLNFGDEILFTGPLYSKNKLEAYVDADVYVLPSVYETFPNTVFEACACGTPIIVTNRCGIADIIDNKIGYVVEYDKNQLTEAIIKVLNSEEIRNKFGERGKKLAREQFSWDKIVERFERIYEGEGRIA